MDDNDMDYNIWWYPTDYNDIIWYYLILSYIHPRFNFMNDSLHDASACRVFCRFLTATANEQLREVPEIAEETGKP